MNAPQVAPQRATTVFQFAALDAMPCGCVAAEYRSWHWGVTMVSLEAKGPHCVLPGHDQGRVLELSDLFGEHAPEEAALP